jgi:hypothetical protein
MDRRYEEKAATQESARSGARTPGWAGLKPQEDHRGTPQCTPARSRPPQESLSTVIAMIRARYGFLAIGLGDGGIRYASLALR